MCSFVNAPLWLRSSPCRNWQRHPLGGARWRVQQRAVVVEAGEVDQLGQVEVPAVELEGVEEAVGQLAVGRPPRHSQVDLREPEAAEVVGQG